jgi:methylmalonyl-CoA/ethylmalonyl-CoA epimerase
MRLIIPFAAILTLPAMAPCQENNQPYVDPGMKQIVQVAIVCKDVEACSQRWARMLGQKVNPIRTTLPGRQAKVFYHGKPSDGRIKMTFFNTGPAVLELMQPIGGNTAWKDYLDKNGEGVQHVAFKVVDVEKTIQSLEQQGMPVIHRGRYDSDDGDYVYVDSQDKLGVTIELLHSDKQ